MKQRYIIASTVTLILLLVAAWVLSYFVAWQIGMGILSLLVILAWNDTMQRIIREKYRYKV